MIGLTDFLMSAYHVSLEEACYQFALPAAAALSRAACVRQGGDLGPEAISTKARIKARADADATLRRHYRIISLP